MLPSLARLSDACVYARGYVVLGAQPLLRARSFASAADAESHADARAHAHAQAGPHSSDGADALKDQLVDAALKHIKRLGWTPAALAAGARDLGLSPAAAGVLPGGAVGFVAHVVRRHNRRLAAEAAAARGGRQQREGRQRHGEQQQPGAAEGGGAGAADAASAARLAEGLSSPDSARRLSAALRRRLEIGVGPYIDTWPGALAALARPPGPRGAAAAGALLAEVADEALAAAGDTAVGSDWYAKRALVGCVYAATELYMLTDFSPSFQETWRQLDRRVADLDALGRAASGAGGAVGSLLSRLARGLGAGWGSGGASGSGASGSGGSWSEVDGAEAQPEQQPPPPPPPQQQQQGAAADGPAGTWPGTGGGAAR